MKCLFNFYGNKVCFSSENSKALDLLRRNFSYFEDTQRSKFQALSILEVELVLVEDIPYCRIPKIVSLKQTRNAVVYELEGVRYCDYYQDGLVIFNKKSNSAQIYCKKISFLHELSYLFVMSRVGKIMDLQGLHRIHACAFKKNNVSVVCMMPMKGGKSTIFLNMVKNLNVEIFSDDTPLVNSSGNIMPFPIRVGINELPIFMSNKEDYVFELERREFGTKKLIDIKAFDNKIAENSSSEIVLIDSIRTAREIGEIKLISRWKMILPLVKYMGVGLGLPIIIEYFLENGIKGWGVQLRILIKRLLAIFRLILKAKTYRLYLGTNRESNFELINRLCEKKNMKHSQDLSFSVGVRRTLQND